MAKRKKPSLDDFVLSYLKGKGLQRSFKLLQAADHRICDLTNTLEMSKKFETFLRSEKRLTPKTEPDDLGFEINFDILEPEAKYPVATNATPLTVKSKTNNLKRPKKKTAKKIPKGSFH